MPKFPLMRRARRFFNQGRKRGGILMYHRVAEERFDPWNLCVTPDHFDEQMAVVRETGVQRDLIAFANPDAFDRRHPPIAVTFDDGYIDNITHALPILEKYEVPATIFVVSNTLGMKREFWWDALTRALFGAGTLPQELEIDLDGQRRVFTLGQDIKQEDAADWNADDYDPVMPRHRLFIELWSFIVALRPEAQAAIVDQILAWAGSDLAPPEGCVPFTADDVARLARHPLIRIGSHTLDHVSLPDCSSEQQRAQIEGCHRELEQITGIPISVFSYPFGRHDDDIVAQVRNLGINLACTSVPKVAGPDYDRHRLPRLQARDGDGDRFARWLADDYGLIDTRAAR